MRSAVTRKARPAALTAAKIAAGARVTVASLVAKTAPAKTAPARTSARRTKLNVDKKSKSSFPPMTGGKIFYAVSLMANSPQRYAILIKKSGFPFYFNFYL